MGPFGFSGVVHVSLMLVGRGSTTSAFTNLITPGPEIIALKHYTLPQQIKHNTKYTQELRKESLKISRLERDSNP